MPPTDIVRCRYAHSPTTTQEEETALHAEFDQWLHSVETAAELRGALTALGKARWEALHAHDTTDLTGLIDGIITETKETK